ncbi:MAG: ABC transporter permease [Phycisphaerales bacterium]|nr:ABC transporter permease [Phycisphaerales bacterium]
MLPPMMFLLEIVRLGLNNLRLHKLRSILTSLGIILGVAAVIVMVAIGEGNKQAALRQIQALGATNIIVRSIKPPESTNMGGEARSFVAEYGLKRADLRRVKEFMPDALHIVPLKAIGSEISAIVPNATRSARMTSQAFGVTPELAEAANLRIARGRYLTSEDLASAMPVAVIGHEVSRTFFRLVDPLGQDIRIDEDTFRIVGVLEPVGLAGGTGSTLVGRDLNFDVHIPMTTAERKFGDTIFRRESGAFSGNEVQLEEIYIVATSTEDVITTAQRARRIMESGHPALSDVQIIVPWELLENAKRTTRAMNMLLTSIAAISLLIGGIGIMNIMLASVTERTREIGIRRALGATRQHITAQFLVETGSLSAAGGVIGIGLGIGISVGLPLLLDLPMIRRLVTSAFRLETQVTTWSIVASFLVAALVGLIFGIYPAVVASRKDPVVALRHD